MEQKKTHRSQEQKRSLSSRAARIEGQMRGIRNLIQEDAYCVDVLTQLSAERAAVPARSREILTAHLSSCVKQGVQQGDEQILQEFCQTIKQFVK